MTDRRDTDMLKDLANARMFDVLAALGVRERVSSGGYISMCNPMRKDTHPSLTIWTKGGILTFKDHADERAKGDVFKLVSYLKAWDHLPHGGFPEACRWLEDLLGVKSRAPAELAADAAKARKQNRDAERQARKDRATDERRAFRLWLRASPIILGTPIDRYLRHARGIDLDALPRGPRGGDRLPDVLRYLPDHPHTDPKTDIKSTWPCMAAACVDYSNEKPAIRAVHRTWLWYDGKGKAPVDPPRKCWPSFAGLVIPLWRGGSNLTIREAIAAGVIETLVLTEGVEDGLTAALATPEHRVWAMISLGNMANVARVLPACVDSVIIHRQNDWEKPQAVEAFNRGKAAIEATGRAVAELAAFGGKDINDTLRGAA